MSKDRFLLYFIISSLLLWAIQSLVTPSLRRQCFGRVKKDLFLSHEDSNELSRTSTVPPIQLQNNHRPSGSLIEKIDSNDQFLSFLSRHPENSLCVVKFHSDTCPTCKRVVMKYIRIANKYTRRIHDNANQQKTLVFFSEVNVSKNSQLASSLDIDEFPFIHIYRNSRCVANFGTGPPENFSKMLEYMLDHEIHMSQDDWVWFESEFAQQIKDGTDKILKLKNLSS